MILSITEDDHGFIYEPHSTSHEFWSTTFEGSEMLRGAGWVPFVMHRVSRHVHESMLIDEWLVLGPLPRARSNYQKSDRG
jgi:hypothetical protein